MVGPLLRHPVPPMTPEEVNVYCLQGMHLRDPSTGMCLECGDVKDPVAEHAELAANEPPRGSAVMAVGRPEPCGSGSTETACGTARPASERHGTR